MESSERREIKIFPTCVVSIFLPSVIKASVGVLEYLGYRSDVIEHPLCCGQTAFNSGFFSIAKNMAKDFLKLTRDRKTIVLLSGSCVHMIRTNYGILFENERSYKELYGTLLPKVFEFSEFLTEVANSAIEPSKSYKVTYHDGCHSLRGLGLKEEPRRLLRGMELVEMEESDVCCGFGGVFSIKYPHISERMLARKTENIVKTGADFVVSTDTGCLLNIKGGLQKRGVDIQAVHISEILYRSLKV